MPPKGLKQATRAPRVWRALALVFSTSAVSLALCSKPAEQQAPQLRVAVAAPAVSAPEPALLVTSKRAQLAPINLIGASPDRALLVRRFQDAAEAELSELALALATLGDAPARATLLSAAHSSRTATREAAIDALTQLDTDDVREFMLQSLTDAEPIAATNYFLNSRDARALPALERLAHGSDSCLRRVAIDALFAQGASAQPAISRLLREDDELREAMLEGQPSTALAREALRRASIERLRAGALTTGQVFEFLQRDLSSDAREALVEAARDPASSDSALNALSARGDSGSLRSLSTLADDADQGLAQRAACALLSQPDSRSRPFLARSNRANLQSQAAAALVHINARGARPI